MNFKDAARNPILEINECSHKQRLLGCLVRSKLLYTIHIYLRLIRRAALTSTIKWLFEIVEMSANLC